MAPLNKISPPLTPRASLQQPTSGTPASKPANTAKANSATAPLWTPPVRGEWANGSSGKPSDPVNLYLHGSLDDIKKSFAKAGWTVADKKDLPSAAEFGVATVGYEAAKGVLGLWNKLTGKHVKNPLQGVVNEEPVSTLTYNGKPQDIAFEKNNDPLGGRHHFRVYDTGKVDNQGKKVWAVAASRDTGIVFSPSHPDQLFLNHVTEPNADHERDTVLRDLRAAGAVQSATPFTTSWQDFGKQHLHSEDNKVYDVVL